MLDYLPLLKKREARREAWRTAGIVIVFIIILFISGLQPRG